MSILVASVQTSASITETNVNVEVQASPNTLSVSVDSVNGASVDTVTVLGSQTTTSVTETNVNVVAQITTNSLSVSMANVAGDKYQTTSNSTLTIAANGIVSLTTNDLGLDYSIAQTVIIAYDINNHCHGSVVSYDGATGLLVVELKNKTGSGTYSNWQINLDGAVGSVGVGVPAGGATGYVLTKVDNQDYNTTWASVGSGTVQSVAGISPIVSSGGTNPQISLNQLQVFAGQSYYSTADYSLDFSGATTAQSVLGGTQSGFVLGVGTYEFEFAGQVWHSFLSSTTMSPAIGTRYTTVTGSPTVTGSQLITYATTLAANSASATSIRRDNVGTQGFQSGTLTSGQTRYIFVSIKGIIRVAGVGATIKFYPAISSSAVGDNPVTMKDNLMFKILTINSSSASSTGTGTIVA